MFINTFALSQELPKTKPKIEAQVKKDSVRIVSDSLLKLSTGEVQVNIIHKGVGQISESDVLLASASDAVIVGFQVRPSNTARDIAENEEIEIRLYSVIYNAINYVKDAMEGMLEPTMEEVITGNVEVREVFKISKVGTVAGCYVTDGLVKRSNQIRLVRDGIVAVSYTHLTLPTNTVTCFARGWAGD